MFEVQDLRYATLATVSRCGMVWFSEDVLSTEMIYENYLMRLRNIAVEEGEDDVYQLKKDEQEISPALQVRGYTKQYHRSLILGQETS